MELSRSKVVVCTDCNLCFNDNYTFLVHQCQPAPQTDTHVNLTQSDNLKILEAIEEEISSTNQCNFCELEFIRVSDLKAHITRVHEKSKQAINTKPTTFVKKKPVDYGAQNETDTTDHLKKEEVRFSCAYCDKTFPSIKEGETHQRIHHTGQKPYKFSHCRKAFSWKSACAVHEKSHSGLKPYACHVCDKSFSSVWQRGLHTRRIHHKETNYKCCVCHKAFFERKDRDAHEARHSTTYICSLCGKSFDTSYFRTQHIKTVHVQKESGTEVVQIFRV